MPRKLTFKPYKSGGRWWLYVGDYRAEGAKSSYETFSTKAEAEARAKQLRIKVQNHGTAGAMLSLEAQIDATKALGILGEDGPTLVEVATEWRERRAASAASLPFAELCELYATTRDISDDKRAEYRRLGKRFEPHFPGTVAGISAAEIDAALDAETGERSKATRKHYRALLRAVLNFGMRRGALTRNPVEATEAPKTLAREPRVLTNAEAGRLLTAATTYREGELLPMVALGLFCGLRKSESHRVSWADIEGDQLYLPAGKAKTERPRYIEISENAQAWLKFAPRLGEAPVPENSRTLHTHFKELRDLAKLKTWQSSTLRHTACSNHYALHRDEAELEAWAGHSREIDRLHYRKALRRAGAIKFWQIVPPGAKKPEIISEVA